jgi:hypothetical protein
MTPETLDLLAGHIDEYEQFRATIGGDRLVEMAAGFVGSQPVGCPCSSNATV